MTRHISRVQMFGAAALAAVLGAGVSTLVAGQGVAGTATPAPSREALATQLLAHRHDRYATPALSRALHWAAGQPQTPGRAISGDDSGKRLAAGGRAAPARAGLANVRVNNPAADHFQVDQTTQSETSIAVAGRHVAVGFNDSQQALLALTDGLDISGYGYSADGGRTFTDGGTLPNPLNFVNIGDPWLTADRAGRMYYATLTYGGNVDNLEVAVARSDDGGRSWAEPVLASPNNDSLFYLADKDAITAGPDPNTAARDNLYLAWDDTVFNPGTREWTNGLPVATSTDHGASWTVHYADKIVTDPDSCSFTQYIGAQPIVDPGNGALFVAAEKIVVKDPDCSGGSARLSEVIFRSTDAGASFGSAVTVSAIAPASPTGGLDLGRGRIIRTAEFPTMALRAGNLWLAWNDGTRGNSHIRVATSTDAGASWRVGWATRGNGDEIQPALSVDRAGLHLAYYQRNPDNTLDTVLADSTDRGAHFTAAPVTSQSFPAVRTVPPFDPQIAFGYMGDYIANVSDGAHQYLAWGDNRDRITNFTHPRGRYDPDVFFARR